LLSTRSRPKSCGSSACGWTVERFIARRKRLFELQYRPPAAEKSVIWCMIIVLVANVAVFAALGWSAASGKLAWTGLCVRAGRASA
jgi:hypothetical protein